MDKMFKDFAEYAQTVGRLQYPQCDKRKFAKKDLLKEVKAACAYGALDVCINILMKNKEEPYTDIDILLGDLQIALVDSYSYQKKVLGLKIKEYTLEDCLKETGFIDG